jgi:hypothetical protein
LKSFLAKFRKKGNSTWTEVTANRWDAGKNHLAQKVNQSREEDRAMRKWIIIFLAMVLLAVFSFGCAEITKETKIKCPKCGAVFTTEEGLKEIQEKGQ